MTDHEDDTLTPWLPEVGALLRQYRGHRSLRSVARAAGVNPATLSLYENGLIGTGHRLDILMHLAKGLGIPLELLTLPYSQRVIAHLQATQLL